MNQLSNIGPVVYGLLVLAFVLLGWSAHFAMLGREHRRRAADLLRALSNPEAVDPWALQQDVMGRSGQRLPPGPKLHNGVALYACLSMEELGETLQALGDAIARHCDIASPRNGYLALDFRKLGVALAQHSRSIRDVLKEHDIGDHFLAPNDAKALLDGTSDLTVTNCGFALSCGFPGAGAYAEVQDSNLSKANPATGIIDKTPDGKWIKGASYREPNLLAVLADASPAWALRAGVRADGTLADRVPRAA